MKVSAKNNKKLRILFIYRSWSSFVKNDYDILKKHFDVHPLQWRGKRDIIKMIVGVIKSDVVFSWFASDHAGIAGILANIFRKKSIVVVGGWDVANIPEINYGIWVTGSFLDKILAKLALKNSDILLPFSKSSQKELLKIAKPKRVVLIYLGIPIDKFKVNNHFKKERIVITVGNINWSNLKRKGIEAFVKSAKYFPEVPFVVIGKALDASIEYLRSIASSNVKFTGYLSDYELMEWYKKAKVYAQLSAHEGFGMSVAEAMLYGCIPVVTNRFALPEVVGNTGFFVEYEDIKMIVNAIKKALNTNPDQGEKCRDRIINMFPLEKREKKLIKTIFALFV